ncbi:MULTISPECIES: nucleoid-associated protein [Paraburkholderia]|uniref:nucleoid-associated protein n=1 Tax=Paraburkholderia TaxID=1822464 RepID=UPI00225AF14A|nr:MULTISPECIES: nucleoid-associated protein [Paraburkholderia]MCX4163577.1 nucleoid-associated protein [Paraburkholderia megapolitana]MDN7159072.1 nucleoid-associated protein [Paraburkholderia sp. CHISQ3]MDQ6496119.1 nucleoid-associated protein [Paraburkholderia megapolitana]
MANEIRGLVVHKFEKVTHEKGQIVPRGNAIEITEAVQRLVDALHSLYGDKSGKGYGKFEDDEDTYPMQRRVRAYFTEKADDFYAFSLAAMNILKGKADEAPLTTGGYVLIAHIFNGARDFLLFAIVTDTVGSAITDTLDIEDRAHVDLNKFRLAGRIDLTGWSEKEERYIGFLKGAKADDVSGYFRHFLGCDSAVLPRQETRKLVGALQAFAARHLPDDGERDAWLQKVVDICEDLARKEESFIIERFSNEMWPQEPELVRSALADADLQLSDGFVPDKSALKPLVKFKASTKLWKLEFDRKAISSGDVNYNKEQGTLTLKNLPDSLKKELDAEDE